MWELSNRIPFPVALLWLNKPIVSLQPLGRRFHGNGHRQQAASMAGDPQFFLSQRRESPADLWTLDSIPSNGSYG